MKGVKSLVEELENTILQFEQLHRSLAEGEPGSGGISAVASSSGPRSTWSEETETWL